MSPTDPATISTEELVSCLPVSQPGRKLTFTKSVSRNKEAPTFPSHPDGPLLWLTNIQKWKAITTHLIYLIKVFNSDSLTLCLTCKSEVAFAQTELKGNLLFSFLSTLFLCQKQGISPLRSIKEYWKEVTTRRLLRRILRKLSSVWAAVPEYHRLGGLQTEVYFSPFWSLGSSRWRH